MIPTELPRASNHTSRWIPSDKLEEDHRNMGKKHRKTHWKIEVYTQRWKAPPDPPPLHGTIGRFKARRRGSFQHLLAARGWWSDFNDEDQPLTENVFSHFQKQQSTKRGKKLSKLGNSFFFILFPLGFPNDLRGCSIAILGNPKVVVSPQKDAVDVVFP